MSVAVMSQVWSHSRHKGSELLLLIAIADFADDSGRAFPSITRLAQKVRLSPRAVRMLIRRLEASGELTVERGCGRGRSSVYRIRVGNGEAYFPVSDANGDESFSVSAEKGEADFSDARFPVSGNAEAGFTLSGGKGEESRQKKVKPASPRTVIRTVRDIYPTQPPPPPSRARARVEEGHHPGPDAAGPRLAADGEGESRDEQEPDRLALIREMQAAVEARARTLRGERRQARFVARAKAIIGGDDYTVWRDGHGRAAPWPDRPRLLRLALARTEGEDDPDLRAALRYVVLQQLDPVEPPTAEELRGHRPPPGSEAAKIRDELPRRNGTHHTSDLVRVGVWMAGDDPAEREQERLDALVRKWEQENPAEAEALRERIAEEMASDPAWQGIARAALPGLVRSRYRLAVRDLLERQEVAT